MSSVYLNKRCKMILEMLLQRNEYMPLQTLITATQVSKRSIYYDIYKVNEWLESHQIPELVVERNKGLFVPEEYREQIEQLIESESKGGGQVFLPSERVKIIICYMIHNKEPVYIDQLVEICDVSRNTIFGDLKVVVNQLHEYDLEIEYGPKTGYRIAGDVIKTRALFFLYFNTLRPLFNQGILRFFNESEIYKHLDTLKQIEKELKVDYVDGCLLSLAALLPIMFLDKEDLHFVDLKQEEVYDSKEYVLIQRYFPSLAQKEKVYLCLHLLGSRISSIPTEIFENCSNQSVYELTKALVMEFEKLGCVNFEDREGLERSLFVHINSSMYRYQYGIQIGNPMLDDIIREYPNLFELTRIVCRYLEQMIGVPMPDSEVAYLALHFGSHLKISKPAQDSLRILIICVNGISTGNMLKREIQKLLPYANIVDVAAADVKNVQNLCDLVISTVKVKSVVPVLVVHPILTDEDRKSILNHKLVMSSHKHTLSDSLFDAVKKYVDEKYYNALKQDIISCLQGGDHKLTPPAIEYDDGLLGYLTLDKIRIESRTFQWQESIRLTGSVLIENGSIESRYIDTIISQTMYYGTYMFLTNEVMLAHAKPEDGVFRTDISAALFKEPVKFPNNRQAKLIFVLAAEDHEKHLKMLNDIFLIVEQQSNLDELLTKESEEEVTSCLWELLNRE